ncbi:MAG: hypothetical protein ACRDI2_12525, partial [Chloroflexota bacterium]
MVALPAGPPDQSEQSEQEAGTGGWQTMRQQLFGEQRRRDAETSLLANFTQLDTRLQALHGTTLGNSSKVSQARAAALRALLDGANDLLVWHGDQFRAALVVGSWEGPVPELGQEILARVRQEYPLFDGAHVADGTIDGTDVVDGVGHLRGAAGDLVYDEVLQGLTLILAEVFDRIASDPPTAGPAQTIDGAWHGLFASIDRLAIPAMELPGTPTAPLETVET